MIGNAIAGSLSSGFAAAVVTGGTLYSDATYYYRAFTSGTANLVIANSSLTADILLIAGGGSGANGGYPGAGGGAGGICAQTGRTITPGTYPVVIGAGGAAPSGYALGNVGINSTFDTVTALGGGGAAAGASGAGGNGGSGGGAQGAGAPSRGGGSATQGNSGGATGYGFDGGATSGSNGGGGGGAGEVGNTDGAAYGGDGLSTWSSWGSVVGAGQNKSGTYWFGGGGAAFNAPGGAGGGDGGGSNFPLNQTSVGDDAQVNTGGGGGSGGASGAGYAGGAGGSGIFIIRYLK